MAVTIANQIENHRGLSWEVTGDGATTSWTVTHGRFAKPNHSLQVFGVTSPTSFSRRSGRGGLFTAEDGTAVAVTSTSLSSKTLTVNTTAAIGNGTKAYFVAVFDQPAD